MDIDDIRRKLLKYDEQNTLMWENALSIEDPFFHITPRHKTEETK